jgi:hypothetical protein
MLRGIAKTILLVMILALFVSEVAVGQAERRAFVVNAFVDERTHVLCYTIGKDPHRYTNNKEFFELLDKMHTTSPNRPFLFLIRYSVPIGGLLGVFLIVDKYELGPARYFLTTGESGEMSEIDREEGGFSIVKPTVPISDNPK